MRIFGFVGLLAAIAIGAYVFAFSSKQEQQTAFQATQQAATTATFADFKQAEAELTVYFAANGTYVGATLDPSYQVVLARADAASYCLEAGGEHLAGPGGSPAPGAC